MPDALARDKARPSSDRLGLPATPLPLLIARPAPETSMDLEAIVLAPVFTTTPEPAVSRLPEAPLRVIWRFDCAPLSTKPTPTPPARARLLFSVGSWFSVRKV